MPMAVGSCVLSNHSESVWLERLIEMGNKRKNMERRKILLYAEVMDCEVFDSFFILARDLDVGSGQNNAFISILELYLQNPDSRLCFQFLKLCGKIDDFG